MAAQSTVVKAISAVPSLISSKLAIDAAVFTVAAWIPRRLAAAATGVAQLVVNPSLASGRDDQPLSSGRFALAGGAQQRRREHQQAEVAAPHAACSTLSATGSQITTMRPCGSAEQCLEAAD